MSMVKKFLSWVGLVGPCLRPGSVRCSEEVVEGLVDLVQTVLGCNVIIPDDRANLEVGICVLPRWPCCFWDPGWQV